MKYTATFQIIGGLSHGFGLKTPLNYTDKKRFESDEINAYFEAMYQARLLAEDALSHPDDDKTTVTILELYGPKGKIDLQGKNVITQCSANEHLLGCHYERKEYYKILEGREPKIEIKEKPKRYRTLESFLK